MSEGASYLAGVIALGLQVNPNLTPEEIETLLRQSATPFGEAFIVNHAGFIGLADQKRVGLMVSITKVNHPTSINLAFFWHTTPSAKRSA